MLEHAYNIIIDCVVVAPGHVREIVDGLNATDKRFLSMLMTNVQLPGASAYYSQMTIHTSTSNTDITLASKFENIFQTQQGHIAC